MEIGTRATGTDARREMDEWIEREREKCGIFFDRSRLEREYEMRKKYERR